MTDTRDELAEWLYAAINVCESPDDVVTWVDRSLASGVLANLRADAWDEGWQWRDEMGWDCGDNPYRNQPGA